MNYQFLMMIRLMTFLGVIVGMFPTTKHQNMIWVIWKSTRIRGHSQIMPSPEGRSASSK